MTNIQAQLEQLFEFEKTLNYLLDNQEYKQFQQQQELFSDKIKHVLNNQSQQDLNDNIEQLKRLKKSVESLQQRADVDFKQLKDKSLLLQRNKKKIKAYK